MVNSDGYLAIKVNERQFIATFLGNCVIADT